MMVFYASFKVIILLICAVTSVSAFCKRPGHYCQDGTCMISSTGERFCECSNYNLTGHDCTIFRNQTEECTNHCMNHGICYNGYMCYCDFGYFGHNCQYKNESNVCTSEYMDINVNTEGHRDVYIRHHRDCKFIPDGKFSYSQRIPLHPYPGTPCGGVVKHTEGHRTTYSVLVDVRSRAGQLNPYDYALEFNCIFEEEGYGASDMATTNETRYQVRVMDENGQFVSSAIDKQSKFSLVFYSTEPGKYSIDIWQLRLFDEKTSRLRDYIIHNGCPSVPAEEWLENQPVLEQIAPPGKPQQEGTVINFRPLGKQYDIVFDYKIKLCLGQCPFRYCHNPPLPKTKQGLRLNVF